MIIELDCKLLTFTIIIDTNTVINTSNNFEYFKSLNNYYFEIMKFVFIHKPP